MYDSFPFHPVASGLRSLYAFEPFDSFVSFSNVMSYLHSPCRGGIVIFHRRVQHAG